MPSAPSTHKRPSSAPVPSNRDGLDYRWTKVAAQARERDRGLCQDCLESGVSVGIAYAELMKLGHANPVDHIIPRHIRPDLTYELSNTRTLCPKHHAIKTHKDLKVYGSAPR